MPLPISKLYQSVLGSVYWKDLDGVYLGANDYAAKMVGFNVSSELIGKTDFDLFSPEIAEEFRKNDARVVHEKQEIVVEESVITPEGNKLIQLSSKKPLYDKYGNVIGILGNTVDITHLKKIETDLVDSKVRAEAASRAKSEFIANISHDLRTPLTGILGMTQDLQHTVSETRRQLHNANAEQNHAKLLAKITNVVDRDSQLLMGATDELLQLCNEILEVVRLESGKPTEREESFNLRELVSHNIDLLQPVAQHKNIKLTNAINPGVPKFLKGQRIYLDRIILNLLSNALKFTNKGSVTLEIDWPATETEHSSNREENKLIVLVKDTGIGIPRDKFETIFEHFSRLTPAYEGHYKGAGLGLYTVKRYVEAMQGCISVNSEIGKGTCFTLILPFEITDHANTMKESFRMSTAVLAQPSQKPETNETHTTTPKASILLVEDNALAAFAVSSMLQTLNCRVDIAETGQQAINQVEKEDYELIFMDIGLPDLSGIDVTKKIRAMAQPNKANIPIIALTGHGGDPEKRQEAIEAGIQDVLNKPAQPLSLQAAITQYAYNAGSSEKTTQYQAPALDQKESSSLNVIDWDACVRLCKGDAEFAHELIDLLANELQQSEPKLKELFQKKDNESLREELHRIRGGICYLSLPQLEEAFQNFHQAVKDELRRANELNNTYLALKQAITAFNETWNSN